MAKTQTERMDDTLAYLKANLDPAQYQEVVGLVRLKKVIEIAALSDEMSIGNVNPFRKEARRAKRALLLFAQLFIEDPALRANELIRVKALPEASEQNLLAEIKSWFIKLGVSARDVAALAKDNIDRMANWDNVNFDARYAIRGVYDKARPFNCYNACIFWAFQAGAISKRFLWNKLQDKDGNTFFPIFSTCGWDVIFESSGKPAKIITDLYKGGPCTVDAGQTVYFETPSKVFGHVALSLGDGTVISQNSVIPAKYKEVAPEWKVEVDKMTRAVTHIISIRELIRIHFHIENAYPRVKVTKTPFYEAFPMVER